MSFLPPPFGPGPQVPQGPQGPQQPPAAPPPSAPPPKPLTASTFAVDPGAIRGCLFRNTYVWPRTGPGFWFYPTFVGRTSVSGFRWTGFFWAYTGISLNRIETFTCF